MTDDKTAVPYPGPLCPDCTATVGHDDDCPSRVTALAARVVELGRERVVLREVNASIALMRESPEMASQLVVAMRERDALAAEVERLRAALVQVVIGKTQADLTHPLGEWASKAGRFVSIAQAALTATPADVEKWRGEMARSSTGSCSMAVPSELRT